MARILIVDDQKENRDALKRALGDDNLDWRIHVAKAAREGLSTIKRQYTKGQPIDVVLTDLVMDRTGSGMVVLQEARRIDPLIMSILFTAKEKILDRYAAFDYGAFDVVEKNIRGRSSAKELSIKTRAALRYREWSQRINFLRRYFDPKVFEAIETDPSLLALCPRTITICFWDIRGFSFLCETLKAHPSEIAGFLREFCETAAQTVFAHGGVLDKFLGDGVMALFGVVNPRDDDCVEDAIQAVRAAIDLRERFARVLETWMETWKRRTPQEIKIGLGCGIHTGEALVGNVGTDFRDQFTALGPHVNFAARLEARSGADQILLSQSTASRVESEIALTQVGKIDDIKNIPGEFKLFEARAGKGVRS